MIDFIGIGAQKAGTTWLYKMLEKHPNVTFPLGKEIHFWDYYKDRGIDWYRSLFVEQGKDMRLGEITPAYSALPQRIIKEIFELNPGLRCIYILRNPIERAWSSALMALQRAEMEFKEASDQWFIDHFRSAGSVSRGDYETCLIAWRSVFDTKQILVLRYEMLQNDPLGLLELCAEHLDIDPAFYKTVPPEFLAAKVHPGIIKPTLSASTQPIRPTLLPILQEIYRPKIASLEVYLDWNLGTWLDT